MMIQFEGKYTKAKVMIDSIEPSCSSQIIEFINHPAFTNSVAIMPDCHAGEGCVIGFTMQLAKENMLIIPNTIGVDIGCGMFSVNVGKNIFSKITKVKLEEIIRDVIPFGFNIHPKPVMNMERQFPWDEVYKDTIQFINIMKLNHIIEPVIYDYKLFKRKCKTINSSIRKAERSIGTLGGGK